MKRSVKKFKRANKKGEDYYYHWIGYQKRNDKGTPCFVREVNISSLPAETINQISNALKAGNTDLIPENLVKYKKSISIGSNWAVYSIAQNLGLYSALDKYLKPSFRDAVLFMITDRVTNPQPKSKRMLSSSYSSMGLHRIIDQPKISFNDWYCALDELYSKQDEIELNLKEKSIQKNLIFMYDITSVYFEGNKCPLAAFGYNRDKKKGKKQIVVGMLTDEDGRPLGVKVFEGNTKDDSTVLEQMSRIKTELGADEFIFVGDRGMVTGSIRDELELIPESGIDYITALKRSEILKLAADEHHPLQPGLFDKNIAEVSHNGIRYIMCFNPLKCDEDRETRKRLLLKTEEKLKTIDCSVKKGTVKREKVIAKRLYTWLNKWNMGKCFNVEYSDGKFQYSRNEDKIQELERLDGCYVITSTVTKDTMDKEEIVKRYKHLTFVEQVFRHMKTTDEFIRPLRHWSPARIKGHVFMCMLAYLVIWQARRFWENFLLRDQRNECIAGSLREIWEALDNGISIGTIDTAGKIKDKLSPIKKYPRQLLKAIGASINKPERNFLNVDNVG